MTGKDPGGQRGLFDGVVGDYDAGRPAYPARVYELLRQRCGLGPGTRVLEIGPGTGQATGRLLELGAAVTAVELGEGLAQRLRAKHAGADLNVVVGVFEEVAFPPASMDLVAAATSFHWVDPATGLPRCAEVLAPGGWLALWWTHFGDPDRPDPFGDALLEFIEARPEMGCEAAGPGAMATGAHPYCLDAAARIADIERAGRFGPVHHELIPWTGRHTPAQLRSLFASYSPWLALAPEVRAAMLDVVETLARRTPGGVVERPYLTAVFLAQRV